MKILLSGGNVYAGGTFSKKDVAVCDGVIFDISENISADGFDIVFDVCGKNIAKLRTELKISQRELADRIQLVGIDIDKNAIQRIECGKRFVTNIEIIAFAKIFSVSFNELLLG